jgi:hypothetical protein
MEITPFHISDDRALREDGKMRAEFLDIREEMRVEENGFSCLSEF